MLFDSLLAHGSSEEQGLHLMDIAFECPDPPILPVQDLEASIDFYVQVLGFAVDFVGPGKLASMSRDQCHLFLSEGTKATLAHGFGLVSKMLAHSFVSLPTWT